MKYKWILPQGLQEIDFTHDLHPVLLSVLRRRGMKTREMVVEFLDKSLNGLHDPFLLKDILTAVDRILDSVQKKEKILIYGDYDADGVTSIAILVQFFRLVESPSDFYIPHRLKEGYGLSEEGIRYAKDNGFKLIVTVDTGINNHKEIELAREQGIDVIITDHHKSPETLPKAVAILNPNQPSCPYPNKHLAGVGVAFKLVHACLKRMNYDENLAKKFLKSLLDYVTLGTIADLASLHGENRKIVASGLKQLLQTPFPGIRVLLDQQILNEKISAGIIAFRVTPKLNASGRTDHGKYSARLLVEEDTSECRNLYAKLDNFNRERQSIEEEDIKTAIEQIEASGDLLHQRVLVVTHPSFHGGVNGIVASKLVEKYHLPAIVFSPYDSTILKGSARSIRDFCIYDCIDSCKDLCLSFGGHAFAAGLTVEKSNLDLFRRKVNEFASEHFDQEAFSPKLYLDSELQFKDISTDFLEDLKKMEPFGLGNSEPIFFTRDVSLYSVPRLLKGKHLKFDVGQNHVSFEVIGFNMGHFFHSLKKNDRIDFAYRIGFNHWQGQERVQLEAMDFQIH